MTKRGPPPKPPGERYEALTIRLHPDDAAALREAARARGLSLGAYVRAAAQHLETPPQRPFDL